LLLAAFFMLLCSSKSYAGGGPENLLLVVNSASAGSMAVANHYLALRKIPPNNVIYIDWRGSDAKIDIDTLRDKLLTPILTAAGTRGIIAQSDYIIYSSGFPWSIDFQSDLPQQARTHEYYKNPQGSLTGLTYLFDAVVSKNIFGYVGGPGPGFFTTNRYMRLREKWNQGTYEIPIDALGVIQGDMENAKPDPSHGPQLVQNPVDPSSVGSHGFRSWYAWGPKGELMESSSSNFGAHYLLSTMLGVTNGRGNTVPEIVSYLQSSTLADGTMPPGTIYFMHDGGVRTTTRQPGFEMVVDLLKKLGVKAEILPDALPQNRNDVQGLLAGVADYNWPKTGSTIRPGAICETLTSWAGNFETKEQTPLSVFLRYGAAGSSGTVTEPFAIQNKFPYATIQLHYARGCTLAEAYYQSVYGPYQLLIVGDPLCRPWANIPEVSVAGAAAGDMLKKVVTLTPTARMPHKGKVDRFELFVDGTRIAKCSDGETLELDTQQYSDGYHELRVVGIEQGSIESQGRQIIPVRFGNYGKTMRFDISPESTVPLGSPIRFFASASGAKGVAFYQNDRVIAKFTGEQGEASVDSRILGEGPISIQAVGWGPGGIETHVFSPPISLTVQGNAPAK
jgi:hypothetical protein